MAAAQDDLKFSFIDPDHPATQHSVQVWEHVSGSLNTCLVRAKALSPEEKTSLLLGFTAAMKARKKVVSKYPGMNIVMDVLSGFHYSTALTAESHSGDSGAESDYAIALELFYSQMFDPTLPLGPQELYDAAESVLEPQNVAKKGELYRKSPEFTEEEVSGLGQHEKHFKMLSEVLKTACDPKRNALMGFTCVTVNTGKLFSALPETLRQPCSKLLMLDRRDLTTIVKLINTQKQTRSKQTKDGHQSSQINTYRNILEYLLKKIKRTTGETTRIEECAFTAEERDLLKARCEWMNDLNFKLTLETIVQQIERAPLQKHIRWAADFWGNSRRLRVPTCILQLIGGFQDIVPWIRMLTNSVGVDGLGSGLNQTLQRISAFLATIEDTDCRHSDVFDEDWSDVFMPQLNYVFCYACGIYGSTVVNPAADGPKKTRGTNTLHETDLVLEAFVKSKNWMPLLQYLCHAVAPNYRDVQPLDYVPEDDNSNAQVEHEQATVLAELDLSDESGIDSDDEYDHEEQNDAKALTLKKRPRDKKPETSSPTSAKKKRRSKRVAGTAATVAST